MDADGEVQLKETESDVVLGYLHTTHRQVNVDTLTITAGTHLTKYITLLVIY